MVGQSSKHYGYYRHSLSLLTTYLERSVISFRPASLYKQRPIPTATAPAFKYHVKSSIEIPPAGIRFKNGIGLKTSSIYSTSPIDFAGKILIIGIPDFQAL